VTIPSLNWLYLIMVDYVKKQGLAQGTRSRRQSYGLIKQTAPLLLIAHCFLNYGKKLFAKISRRGFYRRFSRKGVVCKQTETLRRKGKREDSGVRQSAFPHDPPSPTEGGHFAITVPVPYLEFCASLYLAPSRKQTRRRKTPRQNGYAVLPN
jgi:hypothetical protein